MASGSCMRLCHRCTRSFFVLHSKVAGDALRYSAQVQQYSTAFRISSSSSSSAASSTGFSAVSGKPQHARHRWRRLYSGDVMSGKALSAQATDGGENAGEPCTRTDADAAPCRPDPPSSQRVARVAAPTATANSTALLDPDAIRTPLPVLLEEARDEETVSAARPRHSVLKKTIDEEAVSIARPRRSVLKKTIDEEAVSAARPRRSVLLDKLSDEEEDVSVAVSPELPPPASQSLVDYVDQSETLSKLVQLGVNLWRLEQRPSVGTMLLKLDFQADVAPRLLFLRDVGVEEAGLGRLLSHNPFILTESLENLHARVNYLRSRGFSSQAVASMVARAPYLLNFSVKRLDNRLAFFQQELGLSPDNTRDIVARLPRLLCGSLEPIKETLKVCKVEFGFKDNEVQHIVRAVPKVLTANKMKLTQIFDYVHNTMHVPHHLIVKFPQVLNCAFLRVRERHLFLQYLSRAQYDPGQPRYVSLDRLASLPDPAFCSQVAEATLDDFHLFQKTL